MPPPSPVDHPAFRLRLLDRPFTVVKLKHDEPIPDEYLEILNGGPTAKNRFISLTRTDEEVSLVLESEDVDDADAKWSCIKIVGPPEFSITGVLCNLSLPLMTATIPIYAVSTWNTDYILVSRDLADRAVEALTKDGWKFLGNDDEANGVPA
ncbi:hypothetical protein C8Q77DRAFT_1153910 [Trametes polyzona]|nr:hypothetical protein C8Q77DRAFT_1153910 [Trametes polyzona]